MGRHLWDVKNQQGEVIDAVVAVTEESAQWEAAATWPEVQFTLEFVE